VTEITARLCEWTGLLVPSDLAANQVIPRGLIWDDQPGLSLLVWINALASDVSRGVRGVRPSSGRFVQWNVQQKQVFVAASLGE